MMPDEYEKFNKWYKDNKNTPFLLEEQLGVSFFIVKIIFIKFFIL